MKPTMVLRGILLVSALFTGLASIQLGKLFKTIGILEFPVWQQRLFLLRLLSGCVVIFLVGMSLTPLALRGLRFVTKMGQWFHSHRSLIILALVLQWALFLFAALGDYSIYQSDRIIQGLLIWIVGLFSGLLLKAGWPKKEFFFWLAAGLLCTTALLQVGVLFTQVNNFPFSQSWSEGMLLTNGAQVAGLKVWGENVGFPFINRTYAILQSFSFFLPGDHPLWIHRLWNSVLWFVVPWGLSLALGKRLKLGSTIQLVVFSVFGYLFLAQGPLYFNLALIPLILLLGFRPDKFTLSLALVVLASVWAGLSRLNWYPFAGSFAGLLYVLETPYNEKPLQYFWKPVVWFGAGTCIAFATNYLFQSMGGGEIIPDSAYLSSTILWYRLFPSSTFPSGIFPTLLVITSALLFFTIWRFFLIQGISPWRRLSVLAALLVFLVGGLVVSVKIGGGNNLHNLDGFLILLLVLASFVYFHQVSVDQPEKIKVGGIQTPKWLTALTILLPLIYQMPFLPYRTPVDTAKTSEIEQKLDMYVEQALSSGKSVLFISNQHMLALHRFPEVLPVPEYEVVYMMEMAMTNNEQYFTEFYEKLADKEWGLIVVDSVITEVVGREKSFGEEQNAWVRWVSNPLLKYYNPVLDNRAVGIALLTPRK